MPPPAPSATYNVRTAGANPDGQSDARTAFQAAVDAAQAVTASGGPGAVVSVPSGAAKYLLGGPVYVDGDRVALRGEGESSQVASGYGAYYGPPVVAGVKRIANPARYRPAGYAGWDASVGGRTPLRTWGEMILLVSAHPLQLGGVGASPDYWGGDRYTWEFKVDRPPGLPSWEGVLFGVNGSNEPDPVRFVVTGGSLVCEFKTAEQGFRQFRQASVPYNGGEVTAQFDGRAGAFSFWVDGKPVAPAMNVVGGGAAWGPGLSLHETDGVFPWMMGAAWGTTDGPRVDMVLAGYRVTKGLVYKPGVAPETRLDALPPRPYCHQARYFESLNGPADPKTGERTRAVAWFGMNDAPATHVRVDVDGVWGVGFWLPRVQPYASHLVFDGLNLVSPLQQALAVGGAFGANVLDAVLNGGLQGFGSLQFDCDYTARMTRVDLYGNHAACFARHAMLYGRDLNLQQSGRYGVLFDGGTSTLENVFCAFSLPTTRSYFKATGDGYGWVHRLRDWVVDNEAGDASLRAAVEADRASDCPQRLVVDGLDVSGLPAQAAFVRLNGGGSAAARVEVKNLTNFQATATALRVTGPGWSGSFDASGCGGAMDASPADSAGIRFTPAAP